MDYYLSFCSRPIPTEKGAKSTIDGVIHGDFNHICSQVREVQARLRPSTSKRDLPALATGIYANSHKIGENWRGCTLLHIDLDGGLPSNAHDLLAQSGYRSFWFQSPSSNAGCLKFRVYLFLDRELTDPHAYTANYDHNCDSFLTETGIRAESDRQTKDSARFMYISARPDTFGCCDGKPWPFDESPQARIVDGKVVPVKPYHKLPTSPKFDAKKLEAIARAHWIDGAKEWHWRDGDKHLRLLQFASRGAGYGVDYETVRATLISCLPSSVKNWEAAEKTIEYGYVRPRYPGYAELDYLTGLRVELKYALRRASRRAV